MREERKKPHNKAPQQVPQQPIMPPKEGHYQPSDKNRYNDHDHKNPKGGCGC